MSDQPDLLRTLYLVAVAHRNAAEAKVAVLALPAAAVIDENAVAAFVSLDCLASADLVIVDVFHPVPVTDDDARSGGKHGNAPAHDGIILNGDVGAVVAVVGYV